MFVYFGLVRVYNPCTWEVEAAGSKVWVNLQLYGVLEDSSGYMRPFLKTTLKPNKQRNLCGKDFVSSHLFLYTCFYFLPPSGAH